MFPSYIQTVLVESSSFNSFRISPLLISSFLYIIILYSIDYCDLSHWILAVSPSGIFNYADRYSFADLVRAADDFAKRNFVELILSEEFLGLEKSRLLQLVSSNELNVLVESKVGNYYRITFTVYWINSI